MKPVYVYLACQPVVSTCANNFVCNVIDSNVFIDNSNWYSALHPHKDGMDWFVCSPVTSLKGLVDRCVY